MEVDIIESEWHARKRRSDPPIISGAQPAHLPSRIRRVRDPQTSELDVA